MLKGRNRSREDPDSTMNAHEKIAKDADLKARILEVIQEMENWPKNEIDPFYVATRLRGILSKVEDAQFELRCRQFDE